MAALTRFRRGFLCIATLSVAVFLSQVLQPVRVFAQSESAAMSGRVTDQSDAVVAGAEVEIKNTDTNVSLVTQTNNEGFYSLPSLRPGNYLMNVRKQSFRTISVTGITLNVQDNLSRNFVLKVGSSSESVTVVANAVNINTTDAAVSTVVDTKFVQSMPLNGRSLQDLLTLAPGVAVVGNLGSGGNTGPGVGGEITVNGQRTEANYFTVDGVSANVGTNPSVFPTGAGYGGGTPAETALGTTQSMISVDALQEFRATTSTYSAEYGRTPGGQFSFTTRSGTNAWHGSAYDYFRNEALDANDWFLDELGQPKEKERQNDFGGTLGGPIVIPGLYNGKDRTFFFFSYEGLRLWTPLGVETTAVPDATLRKTAPPPLQPILNAFPLPNDGEDGLNDGLGIYAAAISNPSSIDSVSVRVDHNFRDKFRIFGRYADTPTLTAGEFANAIKSDGISNFRLLTVGATAMITSRQTNELRFNITQNNALSKLVSTNLGGAIPFDSTSVPGPDGKPFPLQGGELQVFFGFGATFNLITHQIQNTQRQYNVTDTHNWVVGRHNLKFGADWRRLATYAVPLQIYEYVEFDSEASVLTNQADSAAVFSNSPSPVEPVYKNFSAFAADDWKVTPRLSLSLGLRWDVNPAPGNLTGPSPYTVDQIANLATTKLAPAGTPLWQTDWHGFAPRIGAAYQVHQTRDHTMVVRGGFGKFYDMGNTQGSTGFGGIGFASSSFPLGASFPLTSSQLALPPPSVAPPYGASIYAFDPHLTLPYTLEWNVAIEQMLGSDNALTVSYVGSAGRRLLTTFEYSPENLGNPNFNSNVCAGCLFITKNDATSDYDALQVQFQRRLSHGLQALASYTWSHSIDEGSNNYYLYELERGSSDFDIRHNFQAAITYDVPGRYSNPVLSGILKHWGLDTRIMARTALPSDIIGTFSIDPVTQTTLDYHPNVVPGQPLYVYGSQYPGGRIDNYNAYSVATDSAGNPIEGNSGRNSARAFGAWQLNMGLRRQFPIHERLQLQFRAEAFNLLNHPNFYNPFNFLNVGPCGPPQPGQELFCFGVATGMLDGLGGLNSLYQIGGPRSLQLSLKLTF